MERVSCAQHQFSFLIPMHCLSIRGFTQTHPLSSIRILTNSLSILPTYLHIRRIKSGYLWVIQVQYSHKCKCIKDTNYHIIAYTWTRACWVWILLVYQEHCQRSHAAALPFNRPSFVQIFITPQRAQISSFLRKNIHEPPEYISFLSYLQNLILLPYIIQSKIFTGVYSNSKNKWAFTLFL